MGSFKRLTNMFRPCHKNVEFFEDDYTRDMDEYFLEHDHYCLIRKTAVPRIHTIQFYAWSPTGFDVFVRFYAPFTAVQDFVWDKLTVEPGFFALDYAAMRWRATAFRRELLRKVLHPRKMSIFRLIELGFN
jgi:hypothetical protein